MNILVEVRNAIADKLERGVPIQDIMDYYAVSLKVVERIDRECRRAKARKAKLHQVRTGKPCRIHRCTLPCRACRDELAIELNLAAKRAGLQGAK